jgi:hypothetical protein
VVVLAGAALAFLGLARAAARRDALDPCWRTPRCAECGAAVPVGTAVCPHCGGVEIGDLWAQLRRDRPAERSRVRLGWVTHRRELRRHYAALTADAPEWGFLYRFLASDMGLLLSAYARFMWSGLSLDPDDPADMRWWASALLIVAGGVGLLGAAGGFRSWAMGLAVLSALLASSLAVAVAGPRAMVERDPLGGGSLSAGVSEAAEALRAEVNAGAGADDLR